MRPRKSQIFASLIKSLTPAVHSDKQILDNLYDILISDDINDKPTLQDLRNDQKLKRCKNWKTTFDRIVPLNQARPNWRELTDVIVNFLYRHGYHSDHVIHGLLDTLNQGALLREVEESEDTDNEPVTMYCKERRRDAKAGAKQQKTMNAALSFRSDEEL